MLRITAHNLPGYSPNDASTAFGYLESDFKEFRAQTEKSLYFNQQSNMEIMPGQGRRLNGMADNLIRDIQKIKRFLVPRGDDFENNQQPTQQQPVQ